MCPILWVHYRLRAAHLALGSTCPGLDERFGQLELSICLRDGDHVYFVKNLTKRGGEGAIVRLNRRADKSTQMMRRQAPVRALGAETLEWDKHEYLVVARLPWEGVEQCSADVFHHFVTSFLRYAGQVEVLRSVLLRATSV